MGDQKPEITEPRRLRADAQQNVGSLLKAAMEVFAVSGVDAPVREIAEKAGVGVGTVYRHFPQRADLIAAVLRKRSMPVRTLHHALRGNIRQLKLSKGGCSVMLT